MESNGPLAGGMYGETIESMNRFFADPENRVMPIVAAWSLMRWKREGRIVTAFQGVLNDRTSLSSRSGAATGLCLLSSDQLIYP